MAALDALDASLTTLSLDDDRCPEQPFENHKPDEDVDLKETSETRLSKTELFEVKQTNYGGYGMFARGQITRGTTLFNELPLITLPSSASADHRIWSEVANLDDVQYKQFRELSHHEAKVTPAIRHNLRTKHRRQSKLRGAALITAVAEDATRYTIWKTNSLSIDDAPDGVTGLYPLFARINHSCDPNTDGHLDDRTHHLSMFTLRDIEIGEEITHTYIDLEKFKTRRQRQKQLRNWCFICYCSRCKAEG